MTSINNLPKISIVMVNYNGLKYLKETICPILELDYPDFEFIIVDNGSMDGSLEFIREIKKIKLIRSPKIREKNFACNYAISEASGDYILLLDNDCLICEKGILKSLLNTYYSNKNVGLIGLAFHNIGSKVSDYYGGYFSKITYIRNNKGLDNSLLKMFNNQQIGFPHGFAIFIKKTVWEDLGGYDNNLIFGGDDNDLGVKSWIFGYRNYIYSNSLQLHLGLGERQDNKKYNLKFKEMFYAHLYTIVKNFTFFNMIITVIGHSVFMFVKAIKQSIFRFNIGPFWAFFQGYSLFLKNFSIAIEKRKEIQLKRVIKEDIFMNIKPIKIY